MKVHLLVIPYDSALRSFRMGAGPGRLLRFGLASELRAAGHSVSIEELGPESERPPAEIRTAFEINRVLSRRVRAAVEAGEVPVILAGNCITAVGTLAGLNTDSCGVLWFDAHGDFNTPETTIGGFLDGMGLAVVTGRCWTQLAATVRGYRPTPENNVLLLGTRDLDPLEQQSLAESSVTVLSPIEVRSGLRAALEMLRERVEDVYLHLDLDVLDPADGLANALAVADGLRLEEVRSAIEEIRSLFRVRALAVTAYDPAYDPDGQLCRAVIGLVQSVIAASPD